MQTVLRAVQVPRLTIQHPSLPACAPPACLPNTTHPPVLLQDGMLFSLEGGLAVGDVPLKAQPQNEHWVDTCFGKEVMKALADKPISCAGRLLGGRGCWAHGW